MISIFTKYELKKALRDKMTAFLLIYPIVIALILRIAGTSVVNTPTEYAIPFVIVISIIMGPAMIGSVIGLSLMDDREDNILDSISTTPLSLKKYLLIKFGIYFIITTIMTIISIIIIDQMDNVLDILIIGFGISLLGPILALLINAVASNKVEAFGAMKILSLLIMAPLIAPFIKGTYELFFIILPGFSFGKYALTMVEHNPNDFLLSKYGYGILGLVINIIWIIIFYKLFMKKIKK